jgi:hypothetical protein
MRIAPGCCGLAVRPRLPNDRCKTVIGLGWLYFRFGQSGVVKELLAFRFFESARRTNYVKTLGEAEIVCRVNLLRLTNAAFVSTRRRREWLPRMTLEAVGHGEPIIFD